MSRQISPFGLRLPPSLKEWVENLAKKEHRSLNSQITVMLEKLKAGEAVRNG